MKSLCLVLILFFSTTVFASYNSDVHEMEDGSSVLSFEEELLYYQSQDFDWKSNTKWRECQDYVTGNYSGFRCSNNRGISVILKNFMQDHFLKCTNQGLKGYNGKTAADLHITHDGIQGDANHSSRSLHAAARAIDIDSMVITYSNGTSERLSYGKKNHRIFFENFRSCWGQVVRRHNNCPYYRNNPRLTGSIGHEDANHQRHVHISVPHCVGGQYSGRYFSR